MHIQLEQLGPHDLFVSLQRDRGQDRINIKVGYQHNPAVLNSAFRPEDAEALALALQGIARLGDA